MYGKVTKVALSLHRTRNANVLSFLLLLLLVGVTLVLVFLPDDYAVVLAGIWTVLALIGNLACAYAVRVRWQQRKSVMNPRRQLSESRRKALKSIANANVRRELVRGAEFGLFLLLGVTVLVGYSTPLIGRGVIVLMQVLILGNVLYDLIEMAYTDQYFDSSLTEAK